jgi:hypothetical protein
VESRVPARLIDINYSHEDSVETKRATATASTTTSGCSHSTMYTDTPVPEIIDPVFAKTSPKRSFCMTENERFGLVFVKTGSINSGTDGSLPYLFDSETAVQKDYFFSHKIFSLSLSFSFPL